MRYLSQGRIFCNMVDGKRALGTIDTALLEPRVEPNSDPDSLKYVVNVFMYRISNQCVYVILPKSF